MSINKKLIVKSNYIVEASYKLSLGEQRLIYVLTSMISSEVDEFKPYKFSVKEFTEILGTKSKDMYTQVAQYVESLREKELTIIKERSILKTKWLSSAEYFLDEGYVELCFDQKLKPYLLLLKERFTKLSLEQMVSFGSQYSGRIYELLKQYQKIGERIFKVEDLKSLLGIGFGEYAQYGLFKQRILNKAKEEINSSSDLSIDFEEIKKSRKVESIRFTIKSNVVLNRISKEEELLAIDSTLDDNNATECDINSLKSIFKQDLTNIELITINDAAKGNINIIREKYELAQRSSEGIDNIVGWMIKAIKNDYKIKENIKAHNFNDYDQRKYDYNDLEKKLLGLDKNIEDSEQLFTYEK